MIAKIVRNLILIAVLCAPLGTAQAADTPPQPPACTHDDRIARMLQGTSAADWQDWIEKLSGQQPVEIGGKSYHITSRYSEAMFAGADHARAFDFVLQQVRRWVPDSQIEIDPYPVAGATGSPWKNLIVTFPGTTRAEEVVVLSAHLDSKSERKPNTQAPGADDNATGSAALLEAARLFRSQRFQRTVQLIWFTGEEWGMLGSQAYARDHFMKDVVGAINLDMFGYDHDNDRCFEMHVGTMPESKAVGDCLARTIQAYDLDLRYDYVTTSAISFSDHSSFQRAGVGAVLVLENLFTHNLPGGCKGRDNNPHYHTTIDQVGFLNISTGFDIARTGIAAAAGLALPDHSGGKRLFQAY